MNFLYISPHLDDAVLSCGGLISKVSRLNSSNVFVLNIFTGLPSEDTLSSIAKEFHKSCGLNANAIEIRKKEEIEASKKLGYTSLFLDYYESQYRLNSTGQHVYDSFDEVFEGKAEKEMDLMLSIQADIKTIMRNNHFDMVYIPKGIGNHVDHIIARKCMENIFKEKLFSGVLHYYEDMPYAYQTLNNTPLKIDNTITSKLESIPSIDFNRKLEAIRLYSSQVDMLWCDSERIDKEYKEYSFFVSKKIGTYYERYWLKKS